MRINPTLYAALAFSAALTVSVPTALGQSSDSNQSAPATEAKPSPYTGVSQPPPDDTIVNSPDTQAATPTTPLATPAPPALVTRTPDPDAGIVTSPVPDSSHSRYASGRASDDPDAGIVTFVPTRPGELPEGTNIHVKLAQQLSSTDTRAGETFSGQVAKDVMLNGSVIIPQGSELRGRVESVREGHRFGNRATIRLRPDAIVLPDGSRYTLHAALIGAHSRDAKVDGEGAITPKSRVKKDAIEEGVGAGTGAVAGAVIGGGAGAVVGTLLGVGVVTTHLIVQRPQSVNMPANTTIVFSLTEPLALTPLQN